MGVMPSVKLSTDSLQIVVLVEKQHFLLLYYPIADDGAVNHKGLRWMAHCIESHGW
jgi:hypothetical protein